MHSICTSVLEIFYEDSGPNQGPPVLMLHGWPDAPRGWSAVAAKLNDRGWRTIIPYLRGSRPTRFLSPDNTRFGSGVALAQDAIDLADKLGLDRFAVVGHDWGARAAYTLSALFPERLNRRCSVSAGVSTQCYLQDPGLRTVETFLVPVVFVHRWRRREIPKQSGRLCPHSMGDLESAGLVR